MYLTVMRAGGNTGNKNSNQKIFHVYNKKNYLIFSSKDCFPLDRISRYLLKSVNILKDFF